MMDDAMTIDGISRRQMLQTSALGFGALALSALEADARDVEASAFSVRPSHFPAKAKAVVFLMQNGGPGQMDLFDPKPALVKYAGQRPEGADLVTERPTGGLLPSPFKFRPCGKSGVPVSELLPLSLIHI